MNLQTNVCACGVGEEEGGACASPLDSLARVMYVARLRTQFSLSLSLAANAWNDFSVWLIWNATSLAMYMAEKGEGGREGQRGM